MLGVRLKRADGQNGRQNQRVYTGCQTEDYCEPPLTPPCCGDQRRSACGLVCSLVTSICFILSSPTAVPEVGRSTSSDLSRASAVFSFESLSAVSCIECLTHFRKVRITASVSMIVTGSASSMLIRSTTQPRVSASIFVSWLTVKKLA
jgi:hypothetical protein